MALCQIKTLNMKGLLKMLHLEEITKNEMALFDKDGHRQSKIYKMIGPPRWQFRITRSSADKYGILKCVGNHVREIIPTVSNTVIDIGQLINFQVTTIQLDSGMALISDTGEKLLSRKKEIFVVSEKLVIFDDGNGKYRLYNPEIGKATAKSYTDFELKENYIETIDGKYHGVLNMSFEEELEALYIRVIPFGDVYQGFTKNGKRVLGSSKWEKPSTMADKFWPEMNGFFRVYDGTRYGYIRKDTGRNLTQFVFLSASDFEENGLAIVDSGIGIRVLDQFGQMVKEEIIV